MVFHDQANLSNTGQDRRPTSALVRGKLPTLQDLDLSENELGARSMQHLAEGQWPALTRLALARSFGFEMVRHKLMQAPCNQQLACLESSGVEPQLAVG